MESHPLSGHAPLVALARVPTCILSAPVVTDETTKPAGVNTWNAVCRVPISPFGLPAKPTQPAPRFESEPNLHAEEQEWIRERRERQQQQAPEQYNPLAKPAVRKVLRPKMHE